MSLLPYPPHTFTSPTDPHTLTQSPDSQILHSLCTYTYPPPYSVSSLPLWPCCSSAGFWTSLILQVSLSGHFQFQHVVLLIAVLLCSFPSSWFCLTKLSGLCLPFPHCFLLCLSHILCTSLVLLPHHIWPPLPSPEFPTLHSASQPGATNC